MGTVRGQKKERAAARREPQAPDGDAATEWGDEGSVPSARDRLRSRDTAVKVFVAGVTFVALFPVDKVAAVAGAMLAPVVSDLVTDHVRRHRWSVRRLRRGSVAVAGVGYEEDDAYAARRRGSGAPGGGVPGGVLAGVAAVVLVGGGVLVSQHVRGGAGGPADGSGTSTEQPGQVVGLAGVTPTVSRPLLKWDAVPNAARYVVHRDGRVVGTTNATHFRDRSAVHGVLTYWVTARAHRVAGPPSERVTIVYQAAPPPPAHIVVSPASGLHDPPSFSWNHVSGANGYVVYRDGRPIHEIGVGSETTYTDLSVQAGTYRYQVAWVRAGVESKPSAALTIDYKPLTGPPVVVPVTRLAARTPTEVAPVLTWDAVNGGDGYRLYRDGHLIHEGPEVSVTDPNATVGRNTYWVTVVVAGKQGKPSNSVTVVYSPVLPAPTGLKQTTLNTPAFTWQRVTGAVAYDVYRDRAFVQQVTALKFQDTEPLSDGVYDYTVKAVNALGVDGVESNVLRIQLLG